MAQAFEKRPQALWPQALKGLSGFRLILYFIRSSEYDAVPGVVRCGSRIQRTEGVRQPGLRWRKLGGSRLQYRKFDGFRLRRRDLCGSRLECRKPSGSSDWT